jgi:histone-lysine N-methyltransferase SETDB1
MEELHRYLRLTKSNMAVDLFDFDFWVHCFAEFVPEKGFSNIKVMSLPTGQFTVVVILCA